MARLIDRFGAYNRFIGVDTSEPMLAEARKRFEGLIACGIVEIRAVDLRTDFPPCRASLIQSILTLQFTPIEYRPRIVKRVFDSLIPGGAFIVVEKVLGRAAEVDDLMVGQYLALKSENGYSEDEINRKRLALEGVLVSVPAAWNEDLLRAAGFREVECFWRWMNFAAWVAVK